MFIDSGRQAGPMGLAQAGPAKLAAPRFPGGGWSRAQLGCRGAKEAGRKLSPLLRGSSS